MPDSYEVGKFGYLCLFVILTTAGAAWPANDSCTVAVSVVRQVGPSIPWPASSGAAIVFPVPILVGAPDLPPEAFVAYAKRQHKRFPVSILAVEPQSGPRRIAMVVGGVRLQTDDDQPMSQAIPVAIAQILSKAAPQDSFALLAVGGPRVALPFGSSQDAIRAAADQLRNAEWERGGKGVFEALVAAASWFGSPQVGDSIILFGGSPNEGGAKISQLRASFAAGRIRLLVFSGSASTTTGGGLTEGTWVRPLARICNETGGAWEEAGYAGSKSADENVKLWQAEAEGLYENIKSLYLLRLERTGADVEIGLAPQFSGVGGWHFVHHPNPLPVCP